MKMEYNIDVGSEGISVYVSEIDPHGSECLVNNLLLIALLVSTFAQEKLITNP